MDGQYERTGRTWALQECVTATAEILETGQLGSPVWRGSWPLTRPVPPAHYALWPLSLQLTDFKERASKESMLWLFPYTIFRDPHASLLRGSIPHGIQLSSTASACFQQGLRELSHVPTQSSTGPWGSYPPENFYQYFNLQRKVLHKSA